MLNFFKKTISNLLNYFNLTVIKSDFLTKIDIDRKHYRYEVDRLNFIFLNDRVENPQKLYKEVKDSESQLFQDLFVLNELNYKKNGFFVEIGAADGKYLSNTYMLEKKFSWDGLVVEPAKVWESELNKHRKCLISNDCVYSKTGEKIIFNQTEKPEFSRANVENIYSDSHEDLRNINNSTYEVTTIDINDLFEKYNLPNSIDYLSIDTEGTEYEILKNLNFQKFEFSILTIEHNFTPNREKIFSLLNNNGYERVQEKFSKIDDWFIKVQ